MTTHLASLSELVIHLILIALVGSYNFEVGRIVDFQCVVMWGVRGGFMGIAIQANTGG